MICRGRTIFSPKNFEKIARQSQEFPLNHSTEAGMFILHSDESGQAVGNGSLCA